MKKTCTLFAIIVAVVISSCNRSQHTQTTNTNKTDTLAIIAGIDKQVDSIQKLKNLTEVKVFKENEFNEDINDIYHFDGYKNLVMAHIIDYDSGVKYYFINNRPIYQLEDNEAGSAMQYFVNGKSFCFITDYIGSKRMKGDGKSYSLESINFETYKEALKKLR